MCHARNKVSAWPHPQTFLSPVDREPQRSGGFLSILIKGLIHRAACVQVAMTFTDISKPVGHIGKKRDKGCATWLPGRRVSGRVSVRTYIHTEYMDEAYQISCLSHTRPPGCTATGLAGGASAGKSTTQSPVTTSTLNREKREIRSVPDRVMAVEVALRGRRRRGLSGRQQETVANATTALLT